jgi:hypothetical protein
MVTSVVLELQRDALNREIPISDLLRKAFVVAKKLKITEFENWVTHELNGYENAEDIPEYRQIQGKVEAWNPYHGWQPVIFQDHKTEEKFSNRPCGQTIAEIENLIGSDTKSSSLQMPFHSKAEQHLRKAIKFDTQVTLIVPTTALVRIADAVRTIILNWSMKLEEDGILGVGMSFTPVERETAGKTLYNINNFYGPVQSPQIQQETSQSIQISSIEQVNIPELRAFLGALQKQIDRLNLLEEVKQELSAEIKTAEAQADSPKPKNSVIKESLGSIKRILEGAGGGVAANLLMQLGSLLG